MNYLVIGGGSGIGKSTVDKLLNEGHNVWTTYNTSEINASTNLTVQQVDTSGNFTLNNLPEELNGLIYAPGSINLAPFHRLKPEDFIQDYEFQVGGAIRSIQQALKALKKGNGSIVLFSTVAVQTGFNYHSQVASSKGAIEGLTRSLAAEFAPTIRVNCIAPSLTNTPLATKFINSDAKMEANAKRHPMQRVGETKDIVNAISFLINPENSWVTGQVLKVDGGISSIKL